MYALFHPSRQWVAMALAVVLVCRGASAQQTESFEGWDLEPGVEQAHLVMVARVVSISQVTVVEGAKTDVALREYRFQPVKRLKGIFGRDQLSMTSADLGLPADDASVPSPLKEGEIRLLVLAQQRGAAFGMPTFGCVSATPGATTFEERVPLVTGPEDLLVGVVETLIKVADSRSRRQRATLLVDRLQDIDGLAAVPLLTSLKLRADWAAADERAYAPLVRLANSPQVAVRGAALEVLRDMLASRNVHREQKRLDGVARERFVKIVDSDEANTRIRVAAIDALGNLIVLKGDDLGTQKLLIAQLAGAATHAERAAAATVLSRIDLKPAIGPASGAIFDALANLPLDELPAREAVYVRAAMRVMPPAEKRPALDGDTPTAEQVLLTRLKRSIAARQSLEAEVKPLGRLPSKESVPHLLEAAGQPNVSAVDQQHIAVALGRLKDDRAVPVLIGWLREGGFAPKEAALAALENIDSEMAAREVRPLLKSEAHLQYKLRIARLLARHGIDDGYALATEHLADEEHTAAAALMLAALDDPRTSKDLSEFVSVRPDRRWYAAALTGLAAIGNADARKELLEILANDRNPLAADAAEATGLTDDKELLVPLAKLVQSRNKRIAQASLVALRRFLSGVRTSPRGLAAAEQKNAGQDDGEVESPAAEIPAKTREALAEAVASLVADAYVDAEVRQEAFAVARLLGGEKYSELLSNLADQAELEGTPLLAAVQAETRRDLAD